MIRDYLIFALQTVAVVLAFLAICYGLPLAECAITGNGCAW